MFVCGCNDELYLIPLQNDYTYRWPVKKNTQENGKTCRECLNAYLLWRASVQLFDTSILVHGFWFWSYGWRSEAVLTFSQELNGSIVSVRMKRICCRQTSSMKDSLKIGTLSTFLWNRGKTLKIFQRWERKRSRHWIISNADFKPWRGAVIGLDEPSFVERATVMTAFVTIDNFYRWENETVAYAVAQPLPSWPGFIEITFPTDFPALLSPVSVKVVEAEVAL